MRILLANSTCKVGGVSTFMLSLHKALSAAGHDCSLFFFERGPMEALLPPDVPVRFGTLADCLRLVHSAGIDVVHANNVDWTTGISAVRDVGARLVLTAHKVREPAFTYGWRASNCDGFAAVAAWIADSLQPFTDAPITVIRNGIDTRLFRVPDASPVHPEAGNPRPIAAWVGRGSAARKRLERFAAVAPALRAAGIRVWIIDQQGPRHFAERCPEAAAALESSAERWDGVDYHSMPATYAEIARSGGCVVSTASMEGLPLSLLEAQACGALVIAADVPGVNECVSADHGGLLYPDDMRNEDLAALVTRTLADTSTVRHKQRLAAAYVAEHFSLERLVRDYTTLYTNQRPSPVRSTPSSRGRASYRDQRLGVGYRQFEASRELAAAGAWHAAAAAGRAALRTAPTMFARPSRLVQLMRTLARASSRTSAFSWTARKGITRV
jgi:glycosyltransferase involved in cell wall biosynthesis